MKEFLVRRYDMSSTHEVEKDMNELFERGYYPKEIKLGDYQNYIDASIIYEMESDEG